MVGVRKPSATSEQRRSTCRRSRRRRRRSSCRAGRARVRVQLPSGRGREQQGPAAARCRAIETSSASLVAADALERLARPRRVDQRRRQVRRDRRRSAARSTRQQRARPGRSVPPDGVQSSSSWTITCPSTSVDEPRLLRHRQLAARALGVEQRSSVWKKSVASTASAAACGLRRRAARRRTTPTSSAGTPRNISTAAASGWPRLTRLTMNG